MVASYGIRGEGMPCKASSMFALSILQLNKSIGKVMVCSVVLGVR